MNRLESCRHKTCGAYFYPFVFHFLDGFPEYTSLSVRYFLLFRERATRVWPSRLWLPYSHKCEVSRPRNDPKWCPGSEVLWMFVCKGIGNGHTFYIINRIKAKHVRNNYMLQISSLTATPFTINSLSYLIWWIIICLAMCEFTLYHIYIASKGTC